MYVCICYGVTDSQIARVIADGADNREEIAAVLGAGSCCGRCGQHLDTMLEQHQQQEMPLQSKDTQRQLLTAR